MPPKLKQPRALPRSVRMLAAIGGLAMASTGELEMTFLVVFLALFLFGIRVEYFPRLARLLGKLQPYLATLFLFIGFIDFFYLSNSFLLSIAHFLLCLQGLRLLSLQTTRDNLGSILLSSLMILSASTLAVEWTFFVMLFFYLPAVIWTLILQTIVTENHNAQDLDVPEALSGAIREKSMSWKKMLPTIRTASGMAFLVSVFCCAFVFVFFPRFNFQGFRGRFLQPVHKSGFTTTVDLQKSGRIYDDNSIVMRVEIQPRDLKKWSGYIRGSVLDRFDGKVWKKSSNETRQIYNNGRGEVHLPSEVGYVGETIRQSIYLESMESPILFALSRPAIFYLDRPFLLMGRDESVKRAFGDAWRMHYEVLSYVNPPYERDALKSYVRRPSNHFIGNQEKQYLLLSTPLESVQKLSRTITAGSKTPMEVASRLSHYLQANYKYTKDLTLGKSNDPLTAFLFETKQGHCEYFASAMTVMLRSLAIPSRIVTGFHSQEWNEKGNYFIVRMRHAHSWVEAFIEPYGWVEFDPSPLAWEEPAFQSPWIKRLVQMKDYMNLRWNRYILSYDLERQIEIVRAVNQRSNLVSVRLNRWAGHFAAVINWKGFGSGKGIEAPAGKGNAPPSGFIIGGAAVAVFVSFLLLFRFRRSSHPVWFYPKLLRIVERVGGRKPVHLTFREFIEENRSKLGPRWSDVRSLSEIYYQSRFDSKDSLSDEKNDEIRATLKRLS